MQVDLNDKERETLSDALKSFLSELKTEISHTDRKEYRDQLKGQEQLLGQVLSKVDSGHSA